MKIIYSKDNKACVVSPSKRFLSTLTGNETERMEHLADKIIPTNTKYEIVNDEDIPSDLTFCNAWEYEKSDSEKTSADLSVEDLAKYNMTENL